MKELSILAHLRLVGTAELFLSNLFPRKNLFSESALPWALQKLLVRCIFGTSKPRKVSTDVMKNPGWYAVMNLNGQG